MTRDQQHAIYAYAGVKHEIDDINNLEESGVNIDEIPSYGTQRGNWRVGKSLRTQRKILKERLAKLQKDIDPPMD